MNYYPKTEYWKPLVTNSESVYKTTNPYFNNHLAPYVAKKEAEFVLIFKLNMLHYPCVRNNLQRYKKVCM